MTCAALIVAAGKGVRSGAIIPKQFALLGGKALICHAADRLAAHEAVSAVFVVIADGQHALLMQAMALSASPFRPVTGLDRGCAEGTVPFHVVMGGAERQDSVRAGLSAVAAAGSFRSVLIHDAARPLVPQQVITRLLKALETSSGAVPALDVVDTLARADELLGSVVDRRGLKRVQTPQAFRLDAIMQSHETWTGDIATDDAQMARAAGFDVAVVEGDPCLDKITLPGDFARMEQLMASQMVSRTGLGFDVHRLEAGQDLWLCGIKLPFEKGLAGHSDADVALHALTDALLGTICADDIGAHFPPSDPKWRGAPSHKFVEHARALIAVRGGIIDHVDLTIIAEAPRIGPYRAAMRASIARMLNIDPGCVSVKATTTERLGTTGRGEGIAAQAVATVRIPATSM